MARGCSGTPSSTRLRFYARVATNTIRAVTSPLDRIKLLQGRRTRPDA